MKTLFQVPNKIGSVTRRRDPVVDVVELKKNLVLLKKPAAAVQQGLTNPLQPFNSNSLAVQNLN